MVKDINNITMLVYMDFMGLLPVFQMITFDVHPWHQPFISMQSQKAIWPYTIIT